MVVGQEVAEGDVLGAMEAMKMELTLKAPFAGTVTEVGATVGRAGVDGRPCSSSRKSRGRRMSQTAKALPERVVIYEVGPRDGLQNEKTKVKVEFIRRLVAAGLPIVEATSFVHPKWVPQLADAAEVMTTLGDEGRDLPVLVPNERGLDLGPRARPEAHRHLRLRHRVVRAEEPPDGSPKHMET